MTSTNYDFIVVGGKSVSINSHNLTASVLVLTLVGGPCGSSLAARLSDAPSKPSVLMIEAGGLNEDPASRVAGERNTFWAAGGLELDYGYKTTPQAALNDRELSYHRGKGLGGSTSTNLGVWDYGSNPELDEWARLVGDDCWKWENVQARYRKVCNDTSYWLIHPVSFADLVATKRSKSTTTSRQNVTGDMSNRILCLMVHQGKSSRMDQTNSWPHVLNGMPARSM